MRIKWLLFKQGFKSMFKYKSQFIIITLLSFLASFYLVATLTTNDRINVLYNDVVEKNGKKYDYEYSKSIGSTKSTTSDSSDVYVMMDDFINNQYTSVVDKYGTTTTTPNFYISDDQSILNGTDDNSDHSSFISDAFSSNQFKDSFRDLFYNSDNEQAFTDYWNSDFNNNGDYQKQGDYANDDNDQRYGELGTDLVRFSINSDTGVYEAPFYQYQGVNSINEYIKLGSQTKQQKPYYLRRFIADVVGSLMNSFTNKVQNLIDSKSDYSTLPLAFQYYIKNTSAWENWKNDFKLINYTDADDWSKNGWARLYINSNEWKDSDVGKVLNSDKDFAYIYSSFSTIAFKMISELFNYEKNLFTTYINSVHDWNTTDPLNSQIISGYNNYYASGDYPKAKIYYAVFKWNWPDASGVAEYENCLKSQMEIAYAYLFGKTIGVEDDEGGTYNLSNLLINPTSGGSKGIYNRSLAVGQKLYDQNSAITLKTNKYLYGLRGMLDQTVFSTDDDGNIATANLDNDLTIYGRYELNKSFSSSRGGIGYDYDQINMSSEYTEGKYINSQKSIGAMEKIRQNMASYVTGINSSLREEGYLYDSTSKKSFRFVILDDNEINKGNQYYKLVEGVNPTSENEILINEQYAMKNNLKIGESINISGVYKVVTGYAVDTLSYYPLVDIDTTMPDIYNGAVVYLSKSSLNNLGDISDISSNLLMTNYYFLSNDNKLSSSDYLNSVKEYNSLVSTNQSRLDITDDLISNKTQSSNWDENWKNGSKIVDFVKSNWYLNWTIQPAFSTYLSIITVVITLIILLLTFIAIAFGIKKNIQANTSQIAYCKSMGVFSKELAFSYVGYSVIISLVIAPVAWVCAGFLQEMIVRIFIAYIATPLYQFNFSWKWLILIIGVVGVTSFIVSILLAIIYNRKPIRAIINGTSVTKMRMKKEKTKKSTLPFNTRFDIKVALRGKGAIISMFATTFLLTTLISILSFLPAAFNKYIEDSQKFFKYSNSYSIDNNSANVPLSPRSTDAWEGDDWLEEHNSTSKFDGSSLSDYVINYYDNSSDYNSSTSSTGIFSKFTLSGDTVGDGTDSYLDSTKWTTDYINGGSGGQSDSFASLLLNALINRIANFNGMSFSMGDLEQLQVAPLYTKNSINGEKYISVEERKEDLSKIQALLKNGIPELLKTFISGLPDFPISDDWRKTLIFLIQSYMPGTFSNYLSSDTRISQFAVGSGTETYVPGKETLATSLNLVDDSGRKFLVDGLKDNQTVYNLDGTNTTAVFQDEETISEIKQLMSLNSVDENKDAIADLTSKGLYDNGTLYVPVIVNKSIDDSYDFDSNASFSTNHIVLNTDNVSKFKSNVIPNGAWIYDNRDYLSFKSGKLINSFNNDDADHTAIEGSTVDPFTLQSSDFIYQYQFSKSSDSVSMLSGTSMFDSLTKDDDGNFNFEVRPYYNYNNVRLYIPKAILESSDDGEEGDIKSLLVNGTPDLDTKVSSNKDTALANQKGWYSDDVDAKDVPESVRKAWEKDYTGDGTLDKYVWIDPYNLKFSKSYSGADPDALHGEVSIDNISNKSITTYGEFNIGSTENAPFTSSSSQILSPSISNIKLKKVDVLKTYNDGVIVADQDILNTITGQSTAKFYPVDNNPYDTENNVTSVQLENGNTINTYDYKNIKDFQANVNRDPTKYLFGNSTLFNNSSDALEYDTQPIWYNKKYSQFQETTGITTGVRAQLSGNLGFAAASDLGTSLSGISNPYTNIDLASLRVGIIISISQILLIVSIFAISGIIIISFLYMMLMADSFVSGFSRFIIIMKALGYKRSEITRSVILIQSCLSGIAFILAITISLILSKQILLRIATLYSVSVPFVVIWWVPLFIIGIVFSSYIIATTSVLDKFLKISPTRIFKD